MAIGATNITTTAGADFIPEIWSSEIIAAYKKNLVMANVVSKINHKGKKGDTLHIPTPTRSNATAKAANTEITPVTTSAGKVDVSLNKHYYYAFLEEDIVKVQSLSSLRMFHTNDAGYALAKQVDTDLINLGATLQGSTAYSTAVIGGDGSTVWDGTANTNTGNGSALTDAGIRKAMQTLDDADVPMENRGFVIPPIAKHTLLGLPRFTEQAFIGSGNAIKTGLIGEIYGVPVYVSTNCATVTAADASTDYRACLLLHKDAIVLAEQMAVRVQSQYKAEHLGNLTVADCIYGVAELRDTAGVAMIVPST